MIKGRVLGSSQVRAKLNAAREAIPEALSRERLGAFLLRRMKERFVRGVDPDGQPWRPLSPNTRRGVGPLRKTGNLLQSIKIIEGNDRGGFATATGAGFRIGITSIKYKSKSDTGRSRVEDTAKYGPLHQLGIGVPKRRILGLGATDKKAVADLVRRELRKNIGKGVT